MLPFVGVDGEGGDIPDETGFTHHQYTMLRVGPTYTTGPNWLTFLHNQPRKHIYVAYFFDYDTTMMLRDWPEEPLQKLMDVGEASHDGWTINYRPRKELVVKRGGRWVTINDVGTFFQCRFDEALKRWTVGTPEQWQRIATGKDARQHFGTLTPETVAYNADECELLAALMAKFRRTCEVIGYLPSRWQGPGQLAKAMFRKHRIPKTEQLPEPPPGVWEMAQAAYYGGRFETSAVGPVKGPIDGWDINSAYPYAATLLPCLSHATWRPTRNRDPITVDGMYACSFRHVKEQTWYGLPVRTDNGSIRFPREGSGWYHGVELLSSQRLGAQYTIHHGWQLIKQCDCKPFDFMYRLYSIRQGIGKSEAGIALKLAMNSAYGVTAQSVGQAPYANPVWAGLFTAHTRARLNEAISHDPHAVFMLATDGLYARSGTLPLPTSTALGGWDRTVYQQGMHIVQPGVYFVDNERPKTRGVPRTAIIRNKSALIDAWQGTITDGHTIQLRQFIGLRLGIARNAWHTIGEWLPVDKRISYDWSTKRRPVATRTGHDAARTVPYAGDVTQWTVPYDRPIGGNLARAMDRLEFADTPDWAESLTEHL